MSQSKKLNNKNNNLGKAVIKYADGGFIPIDGNKNKTKDKRKSTDSVIVNPIKELGHYIKRVIPTNMGDIPYSKNNDPEYINARKDFVNWYSNPATIDKFEKNTRYDPNRLKDFISKGTSIPAFKGTAQKQPPVGSKAVFTTPDTGDNEEILYHSGVGSGVIQHELTHASALANILGPALLRVTGQPKDQVLPSDINDSNFKSTSNSIRDYMSIPSEAYGNFHEFRVKLGLEPGQQINRDQLRKLVKEKNLGQENFYNTFEDDNIVNAINTIAYNNNNDITNYAAMGGYLKNTKQYALGGELTQFNTGGMHEQNPNGGIPIGSNSSVEEGETMMTTPNGQFVFSDRIQITPDMASKLNLPKSFIGKTMSDYSKKIDRQFKDRNDTISRSTKQKLLDRGARVQEEIKEKQKALEEALNVNMTQDPDDMLNGQIPSGAEEYLPNQMRYGGKKMFAGGPVIETKPSIVTNEGQLEALKNNKDISSNSSTMAGLGIASQALGSVGQGLFQENANNMNYTPQEQLIQSGWEKTKDVVGTAIPIAGIFRGAEKLGKGLGQSIGGDKGGDFASGFLDPFQNVLSKDTNIGEKALSVLDPVVSGIIMQKKNEKRRAENIAKNAKAFNAQFDNQYALGGYINNNLGELVTSSKLRKSAQENANSYANGGTLPKPTINDLYPNLLNNYDINSEIVLPQVSSEILPTQTQADFEKYYTDNIPSTFNQRLQTFGKKVSPYLTKAGDKLGNALRYAPLAMDAYQLSQLKKPQGERLDRLNNRYIPQYTDLAAQQNLANQELNNVSNAIQASGASQGAIRSSLLGAQLNKNKALSQAYMEAEARNAQQNAAAQQFNLGIDSTNLQQSNIEKDINARNLGAYETQKSRLLGNIGTTAGEIGKEEKFKDITKQIFGYDSNGRYVITPEGQKMYISSTTQKKLGGLIMKKRK